MVRYTGNVGVKFHPDRSARRFPGNTVICHVPKDSAVHKLLQEVRDAFVSQKWAAKFAFLPPSSYHMTVFEGVCEQRREPRNWTKILPTDASLEDVDTRFKKKWGDIEKPQLILMNYDKFWGFGNITVKLKPASDEMNRILRKFRDCMAEKFQLKFPGHELYTFHISLAYKLQPLTIMEKRERKVLMKQLDAKLKKKFGTLKLLEPELTFFEDMTHFAPSRELATQNCRE